jgi:Acetyltransferase (GNAT) family.
MQLHIRQANLSDANDIADILADGWARAYSGFMPAEILAPRADRDLRRKEIAAFMAEDLDPAREALFVAEDRHEVAGFVHCMLGDKADLGAGGHINLIYVREIASGRGIGRRLLTEGADWLADHTRDPIAIAAYEDNPFHPFYAHLGSQLAKTIPVRIGEFECRSVIYLWPSPLALARQARLDRSGRLN